MADPLQEGGIAAQGAATTGGGILGLGSLGALGGAAAALGPIGLGLFAIGAIASPIIGFFGAQSQADAIREQARRERGITEQNIGLRFLDAERRASTLRARAGASGVSVGGSPRVAEHQIFAYERMQEDVAITNANSRMAMANKQAGNIETMANLNLGFGLAGGIAGAAFAGYGLAKAMPQYGQMPDFISGLGKDTLSSPGNTTAAMGTFINPSQTPFMSGPTAGFDAIMQKAGGGFSFGTNG